MIMKYCGRCDKNLPGEKAWFKHRTYSRRHHICYKCGETDFESRVDYNNHRYVDNRHKYCDQCDLEFDVASDLQTHCAQGHTYCDVCGDHFRDAKDLKKHFVKSGEHAYCGQCQFHFHAETNLREVSIVIAHLPHIFSELFNELTVLGSSIETEQLIGPRPTGAKDVVVLSSRVRRLSCIGKQGDAPLVSTSTR